MAEDKPAGQLQLEDLIRRRAGLDTAIRELENYLGWRRKHPPWWKRAGFDGALSGTAGKRRVLFTSLPQAGPGKYMD